VTAVLAGLAPAVSGEVGAGFRTEFPFELPRGYVDGTGTVHRSGVMRLATARDEIQPLRDPRVQANEAYLTVLLLSRVVTRLGSLPDVGTTTIEGLFATDLAFLQLHHHQYPRRRRPGHRRVGSLVPAAHQHRRPVPRRQARRRT